MAGSKSKGNSGRKVKDKWKAKEWYNVHAPRMFNEMVIGETPASDPSLLIGRTSEVTVQDITGDFSKMHIKLKFKVSSVDGHEAKTVFIGHDLTSDYVRRLTRRKKTKTDHVVDVRTSDNFKVRVKTMSIAERRIQSSQEQAMRQIIEQSLLRMAKEMTVAELIKAIISGGLAKDVAKDCYVIIPIKRIEIRKTEIQEVGEGEPESIVDVAPEPIVEESIKEDAPPEEEKEIIDETEEASDAEVVDKELEDDVPKEEIIEKAADGESVEEDVSEEEIIEEVSKETAEETDSEK